jgi:uncharacterized protein YndB with AHSA1/START domain
MGHREVSIEIAGPPDDVYDIYVDATRTGEWHGGVKAVEGDARLDRVGAAHVVKYGGPYTVRARVLTAERPSLHRMDAREMAGFVNCVTTARFEPIMPGTRLTLEFDYRVVGGPIGRLFDGRLGDEMEAEGARDLGRLKALAERDG